MKKLCSALFAFFLLINTLMAQQKIGTYTVSGFRVSVYVKEVDKTKGTIIYKVHWYESEKYDFSNTIGLYVSEDASSILLFAAFCANIDSDILYKKYGKDYNGILITLLNAIINIDEIRNLLKTTSDELKIKQPNISFYHEDRFARPTGMINIPIRDKRKLSDLVTKYLLYISFADMLLTDSIKLALGS
ncbi:MAG: hypothetical protein KatS3mg083_092 [Candidatus Dojkabacteria bacterium]|nr:MAG: hypothetical protein KatS3mg083_092 [Candidatus Dojkabacteria bacterium]